MVARPTFLARRYARSGFTPKGFFRDTNRLVYWVGLPSLLFYKTAQLTGQSGAALRILGVLVAGMAACIVMGYLLGWVMRVPRASLGAFVQGSYRGNLAFVGLPVVLFMLASLGGGDGHWESIAVLVIAPLIPIYNIVAVIVLQAGRHTSGHRLVRRLGMAAQRILTNPLVVSCALGILYSLSGWGLPQVISRTCAAVGQITLPLALMGIGASLTVQGLRGALTRSLTAALIKVAVAPLAGWLVAAWMGLSPMETRIALIYLTCPTAAVSYVMASQLGADEELSAHIILLSVLLAIPAMAIIILIS